MSVVECSIVVPTVGHTSLGALLRSLLEAEPDPRVSLHRLVLVDDRPAPPTGARAAAHAPPTTVELGGVAEAWLGSLGVEIVLLASSGVGPAGAATLGIAATTTPCVVVLDDDATVSVSWWHDLADLYLRADRHDGDLAPRLCGHGCRLVPGSRVW